MNEPILTKADHEAWKTWMDTAETHAKTRSFRRAVDSTKTLMDRASNRLGKSVVAWSGVKDSTVMTHLVCVELGIPSTVLCEKDDLDYPGEEDYVHRLGAEWGLNLRVIKPAVSPQAWVEARLATLLPGDDIHSRSAGLSKACFYHEMEAANRGFNAVMLGLRAEESGMRRELRNAKGRIYKLASGQIRILPIANWSGIDVYAYAVSRGIELLPVYKCVGFMHADEPWRIRKSWWLPGSSTRFGQVAWLRRYYPSLYDKLVGWMPDARLFA